MITRWEPTSNRADIKLLSQRVLEAPVWDSTSERAAEALRLAQAGLSVFPLRPRSKEPLPYSWTIHTRQKLPAGAIPHIWAAGTDLNVAVALDGNHFVIDADAMPDAGGLLLALRDAGIVPFGWWSGRGAHFVFEADGFVVASGKWAGGDVKGAGSYVVAVGSVHPSGATYQWFDQVAPRPPRISAGLLRQLVPTVKVGRSGAADRLDAYLSGPPVAPGGRDNAAWSAAVAARAAGVPAAEAVAAIRQAAVDRDGLAEAEAKIGGKVARAYSSSSSGGQQRGAVAEALAAFRVAVDGSAGSGQRAATDNAVFAACVHRWRLSQRPGNTGLQAAFRASAREVAELARCTRTTASKALRRLVAAGVLQWVPGAADYQQLQAREYRFGPEVLKSVKSYQPPTASVRSASAPHGLSEVAVRDSTAVGSRNALLSQTATSGDLALGRAANLVYRYLLLSEALPGVAVSEAAEVLGLSAGTARRWLAFFCDIGVTSRTDGRPRRYRLQVTPAEAEALVNVYLAGVPERRRKTTAERKQQHEGDRSARLERLVLDAIAAFAAEGAQNGQA